MCRSRGDSGSDPAFWPAFGRAGKAAGKHEGQAGSGSFDRYGEESANHPPDGGKTASPLPGHMWSGRICAAVTARHLHTDLRSDPSGQRLVCRDVWQAYGYEQNALVGSCILHVSPG